MRRRTGDNLAHREVPSPQPPLFGDGERDFRGSVAKYPVFWRRNFGTAVVGNTAMPRTAIQRECVYPAMIEDKAWRQLFPAGVGNNYRPARNGLSPVRLRIRRARRKARRPCRPWITPVDNNDRRGFPRATKSSPVDAKFAREKTHPVFQVCRFGRTLESKTGQNASGVHVFTHTCDGMKFGTTDSGACGGPNDGPVYAKNVQNAHGGPFTGPARTLCGYSDGSIAASSGDRVGREKGRAGRVLQIPH